MNCAALVGHDLGDLERIWEARPESARSGWRPELETVVAGQVVGLRKKGDSQMFVQIEDGRGRLECAFFAETYNEFAPLIARDRLLIVQGGLREDAFSGGFALQGAALLGLRAAVRQARAAPVAAAGPARTGHLVARGCTCSRKHRPGPTPLRLDLLREGVAGMLDLNGTHSIRVDADLPGTLRSQPGVRTVKLAFSRPW